MDSLQESLMGIWGVVLAPSMTMLCGSFVVRYARVPDTAQACFQNFSAGLLISAVAGELFPLLSNPGSSQGQTTNVSSFESNGGLIGGFTLGLLFMFGLEKFMDKGDDESSDAGSSDMEAQLSASRSKSFDSLAENLLSTSPTQDEINVAMTHFQKEVEDIRKTVKQLKEVSLPKKCRDSLDEVVHHLMYQVDRAKRQLTAPEQMDDYNVKRLHFHVEELSNNGRDLISATNLAQAKKAITAFEGTLMHIHEHAERKARVFRRWNPVPKPETKAELPERMPWTTFFSVVVDSAVDGLLVGLSYTASPSAGWCMSIATCLEMGFLGLSFACSMQHATRSIVKQTIMVSIPPLVLFVFGLCGFSLGALLAQKTGMFIGFISFAIVALLFLVTQELLTEAKEKGADSMFVNVLFFVGLLSGILLEKVLG